MIKYVPFPSKFERPTPDNEHASDNDDSAEGCEDSYFTTLLKNKKIFYEKEPEVAEKKLKYSSPPHLYQNNQKEQQNIKNRSVDSNYSLNNSYNSQFNSICNAAIDTTAFPAANENNSNNNNCSNDDVNANVNAQHKVKSNYAESYYQPQHNNINSAVNPYITSELFYEFLREMANRPKNTHRVKPNVDHSLVFQSELLKNVLKGSQMAKQMQKQLININVHDFESTSPPPSHEAFSIPREYLKPNRRDKFHANDGTNFSEYEYNMDFNNYVKKAKYAGSMTNESKGNFPKSINSMQHRSKSVDSQKKGNYKYKKEENDNIFRIPKVGEIKVNIDDIKKGLLSYYSNIFSLDEYNIEERINILKYGDKQIPDTLNADLIYKKKEEPNYTPFNYYNEELHSPYSTVYQTMPPDYYYSSLDGRSRARSKSKYNLHQHAKHNNGTDEYRKRINNGQGGKGESKEKAEIEAEAEIEDDEEKEREQIFKNTFDHHGQFSELLNSIKHKCEDATFRVTNLTENFNEKYENPDNRFYIHNMLPTHLRKPKLDDDDDIRRHIIHVYAQLYNEAHLNKKKINALEKKLHVLKLKSKEFKNNKRGESRNAM